MSQKTRILISILLLTTILTSTLWFNPSKAQEGPKGPGPDQNRQFNGTYVAWKKEENTTQENWNWQNQAWEFGPYPTFNIFLLNGTEVVDANFIPLGTPFKTIIYIQMRIFMEYT